MNRFALVAVGFCSAVAVSSSADAAVLASYTFTGSTLASSDTDVNSTASLFQDGSGYVGKTSFSSSQGNPAPSRQVNGAGQSSGASATTNRDNGQYFFFTVTAAPGFELDLDGISLEVKRNGSSPDRFTVYAYPNGTTATQIGAVLTPNTSFTAFGSSTNLQATTFQNLNSIEIRAVFFGNNQTIGSDFVDNVVLSGTASPVPEPASIALLGLGGLSLLRRRRASSR